eukprot:gb/GECG01006298.1/.p1 GENE.gb/GECG01006298.1/~~gb/GECG01006298.1/.p1  ORF type:complete len:548 (+),score=70.65 gb/GECG01006298.1/:1-1644(+)
MQIADPWQLQQLSNFLKTGKRRPLPRAAFEFEPQENVIPPWEGDEIRYDAPTSGRKGSSTEKEEGTPGRQPSEGGASSSPTKDSENQRGSGSRTQETKGKDKDTLTSTDFSRQPVAAKNSVSSTKEGRHDSVSGNQSEISLMMSQRRTIDANRLGLRIYLPSKKTIEFSVPFSSTVEETITEVMRLSKVRGIEYLPGSSECYELRLHDDDGEIDEDFPPLERDRKIHSFGRGRVNEYVLCSLPDALSKMKENIRKIADGPGMAVLESRFGPIKQEFAKQDIPPTLRVIFNLGKNVPVSQSDVPLVHDAMTVRDVLEYLNAQHRLNLFQTGEILQLQVGQIDQERLKLADPILPLDTKVAPLRLENAVISRKVYLDASRKKPASVGDAARTALPKSDASSASKSATPDSRRGPAASKRGFDGGTQFTYNIITASEFKEWEVIKINKRGRRQERWFGLDLARVTNRKVEKKRVLSDQPRRAERLVTSIEEVTVHNDKDQCSFTVTYQEKNSSTSIRYLALNPYEREEIIAKMEYILALNNDSHKIRREG